MVRDRGFVTKDQNMNIVYEDNFVVVIVNSCGEVFVKSKKSQGVAVRVTPNHLSGNLVCTAGSNDMVLDVKSSCPCVVIKERTFYE